MLKRFFPELSAAGAGVGEDDGGRIPSGISSLSWTISRVLRWLKALTRHSRFTVRAAAHRTAAAFDVTLAAQWSSTTM
jgi:hypothetical protein